MSAPCLYMPYPEHTLRGKAQNTFRRLSYDLWRRELNRFRSHLRKADRCTIVDVGCGPGFLLACLERWFPVANIFGIDANDDLLQVARTRCGRVTLLNGDACNIPLPDQSADVVFALHVIEHLRAPAEFFFQARRILRPGGLLIVATPNADGLGARLMKDNWRGYSDPTHVALNGPKYWHSLISESGFVISREGTTGLAGIPGLNKMPLGLIHWAPTFLFGFFPWKLGEAYICTGLKQQD